MSLRDSKSSISESRENRKILPPSQNAKERSAPPPPPPPSWHALDREFLSGLSFETQAIHSDRDREERVPDIAPPIHVSSTYLTGNPEKLTYSRAHTMTRFRLEKVIAQLEGEGSQAVVYSSGMATCMALLYYYKPTEVFISAEQGYFGIRDSIERFSDKVRSYGGSVSKYDLDGGELEKRVGCVESGSGKRRTLIWLETPKNPTSALQDIEHYSEIARKMGSAIVVVDATFATAVLQRSLDFGADFVVHSCSKQMSGHSDVVAGCIVTRSEAAALALRSERNAMGFVLGNLEAWLLLRSLRTMKLRVLRQSETAAAVASWLEQERLSQCPNSKYIKKVWYPLLESNEKDLAICRKQMGGKGPCVLSLELDTVENALGFQKSLLLFADATSLGGVESLIDYRYRWDSTVSPTLLRISIGLEAAEDLIRDMDQAFRRLQERN